MPEKEHKEKGGSSFKEEVIEETGLYNGLQGIASLRKKDFLKEVGVIGGSLNLLALIIFFVSPASLLLLIIPGAILCLIATIGHLPII
ncbi:MAG: hypothetical protein WAX07_09440 [Candidatus Altiarchaeia archaeon]